MIGQPVIEDRQERHYVGIRTQVPIRDLGSTIPTLLGELFAWLGQRSVAPDGPPLIRYHVIDMAALMDVELGVPVASPQPSDGRVGPGVLPAGRYAALVYTGRDNGTPGTRRCWTGASNRDSPGTAGAPTRATRSAPATSRS